MVVILCFRTTLERWTVGIVRGDFIYKLHINCLLDLLTFFTIIFKLYLGVPFQLLFI